MSLIFLFVCCYRFQGEVFADVTDRRVPGAAGAPVSEVTSDDTDIAIFPIPKIQPFPFEVTDQVFLDPLCHVTEHYVFPKTALTRKREWR